MPIDFETKYPTLDREIAAVLSNSPEPAVFSAIEEERVVVVAGTQQLIKGFEDRIPSGMFDDHNQNICRRCVF